MHLSVSILSFFAVIYIDFYFNIQTAVGG